MPTFLFDQIIFGPVISRRLGVSLGINLLPSTSKVCNFDCIYCECGLTESTNGLLPERGKVAQKLEAFLKKSNQEGKAIDAITFAGNGEPTMHAEFAGIIDDTYNLRNLYYPKAEIALLTNATTLGSSKVIKAFEKIDQCILKLDSVNPSTVKLLNCPLGNFSIEKTIERLKQLKGIIIQTMFVKGSFKGIDLDNTTEEELVPWLETLSAIRPSMVMIYTIARDTPFDTLEKVTMDQLQSIGKRVEALGIQVQISG